MPAEPKDCLVVSKAATGRAAKECKDDILKPGSKAGGKPKKAAGKENKKPKKDAAAESSTVLVDVGSASCAVCSVTCMCAWFFGHIPVYTHCV